MCELGMCYINGRNGFDKNLPEGLKYIRMAAERGYAKAQYALGSMYGRGKGVPQDEKKAFDLCMQAAGLGKYVFFSLGKYKGEGTPRWTCTQEC